MSRQCAEVLWLLRKAGLQGCLNRELRDQTGFISFDRRLRELRVMGYAIVTSYVQRGLFRYTLVADKKEEKT